MIISYFILEEFLLEKFHSLESIRVDDWSFFGEGNLEILHIVFSGCYPNGGVWYNFGEDVLLSDFQDWLSVRRQSRLGDLGIC